MPNILDEFPYPWHKKEAQQLHITLSQLNATNKSTVLAAEKSGIDVTQIFTEQQVTMVWVEILNYAATHGMVRKLVQDVFDRLAPTSPARPFLEELLQDAPVVPDAEPRAPDGAPLFIKDTDEVSEPEALLYRDDLTLQIGRVPALVATLQKLMALAPSVCRLTVDFHGTGQYGTAFRIGPDLLLTNWHVLHKKDGTAATAATAEFGYEDDGAGGVLPAKLVKCDVTGVVSSKQDDWAVIRAQEPLEDGWPVVRLSEAVDPVVQSPAYIIQHPGGNRKRLGFVRNQVSDFDDRVVHYLTDTEGGSSGSPVFDASGKLFALHHAGGRPQEVVGRLPVSKNEGIRISRIVQALQKEGVAFP